MKKITLTFCILHSVFCIFYSHAQSQLWGMTSAGGDGFGTIFKTDGNGNNQQVLQTFTPNMQGINPGWKLCEAPNGKLYGMTYYGGVNGGVIFEYDPSTNAYIKKIDLTASNGNNPIGSLMLASNGKFYGMTRDGGATNRGVIFEYDYSSNIYTKKIDLDSAGGGNPSGSLMQASNGKLYGMTPSGGANNKGVIFEYDYSSNTYTKKIDLDSAGGSNPDLGNLIEASNGKLYGMTGLGGATNGGVIFEYDYSTNTYTKKFDFSFANGSEPGGSLMQASNGKFYGMTSNGGANNWGVIFEYDYSANAYTKKMDFSNSTGFAGNSFVQASNGKLYGTTNYGGNTGGGGVIFEYDYSTDTYTKKKEFNSTTEGDQPTDLIQASNGKLYGTARNGGNGGTANDAGVIFEYDYTSNTFSKKIDFNLGVNGSFPDGSLMLASNGKIYGTTPFGGANGKGVIFEYDYSANVYIKKFDFDSSAFNPKGSLIEASNGKLYGTANGGANNAGIIFEYDYSANTFTKKINLINANGSNPTGPLMKASNGKIYGMTTGGGANNDGVIFEYDYSANTYTKKIDINNGMYGSTPVGSMSEASNGKLYGMTGADGFGTDPGWIFEYDYVSNSYTKKIQFSNANGRFPLGSLMPATNGNLYGMTSSGGATDEGVIFEYDYSTNTCTKKIDLGGTNGKWPSGSLMQASNGKLYGMTYGGGTNNAGVIFEYDYSTNTFMKKSDFTGVNGSNPGGTLIETGATSGIDNSKNNIQFTVFPNPSSGIFTINFQNKTDAKICIYDVMGNCVLIKMFMETGNREIDLSSHPKGIYFVEINADKKIMFKKIVLQ